MHCHKSLRQSGVGGTGNDLSSILAKNGSAIGFIYETKAS